MLISLLYLDARQLHFHKYDILEDLTKLWKWLVKTIKPFLNWKVLVSFGLVWSCTHLWAYIGAVIGKGWFKEISLGWLAFIYLPMVNENILITFPVSIWLYKTLFKAKSKELEKMYANELQKEKKRGIL